jgi:MYXO-CTERM domain-containing protein
MNDIQQNDLVRSSAAGLENSGPEGNANRWRSKNAWRLACVLAAVGAIGAGCADKGDVGSETSGAVVASDAGKGVVISQVYGGGGGDPAAFKADYVELFNRTDADVSLAGLTLQYGKDTANIGAGDKGVLIAFAADAKVPARGYFLVGLGTKANTDTLRATAPEGLSGNTSVEADSGRVALVRGVYAIDCGGKDGKCAAKDKVVDVVSYGSAKAIEGTSGAATSQPLNSLTAAVRAEGGCKDIGASDEFKPHAKDETKSCEDGPGPTEDAGDSGEPVVSPTGTKGLVISQVYGGSGFEGAVYKNDFVELFNNSDDPISLDGLSLQYAAGTYDIGSKPPTSDAPILVLPNKTLEKGQYFLIVLKSGGEVGDALPVDADATGTFDLNFAKGKVAIMKGVAEAKCGGKDTGRCDKAKYVDMVGYGGVDAVSDQEGDKPAALLDNGRSSYRKGAGCQDTNQNADDFVTVKAVAPRNMKSDKQSCPADLSKDPKESAATAVVTTPKDAGKDSGKKPTDTTDDNTDDGNGDEGKTPRTHDVDAGKGVPTNANSYEGGCSASSQNNSGPATALGALIALGLAVTARRRQKK